MKITDLFKQQNLSTNRSSNAQPKPAAENNASEQAARSGQSSDTISISPLSRQLSQISSIIADEESRQADRVAEIKARVEDGSFNPSSDEVAKAIVNFSRD